MNVLVLNNFGGGVSNFLVNLSKSLAVENCVTILFDSMFAKMIAGKIDSSCQIIYLNDLLESNQRQKRRLPPNFNCSRIMCSDIERSMVYRLGDLSSNDYESICDEVYSVFYNLIIERKIDIVIYENISNSLSYIAYAACMTLGIKYCGITSSRVPGYFSVDSGVDYETQRLISEMNAINTITDIEKKNAQLYLDSIDTSMPDGLAEAGLHKLNPFSKYLKYSKLRLIAIAIYCSLFKKRSSYMLGVPIFAVINQGMRSISRFLNHKAIVKYYTEPDFDIKYFLYPLHFHPESSTSVRSPEFMDELSLIRTISFYLPNGHYLYVKDHPSAAGYPKKQFYKELCKMPYVRLISSSADTKKLIRFSKGVITQTGTAGLEALMLRVPVIAFGEIFYKAHAGCKTFSSWKQFSDDMIDLALKKIEISNEYNIRFLNSYLKTKYPGVITFDTNNPNYLSFVETAKKAIYKEIQYL